MPASSARGSRALKQGHGKYDTMLFGGNCMNVMCNIYAIDLADLAVSHAWSA
jgi:hypothetical protein